MAVKACVSLVIHLHVGFEIGISILSKVSWTAVKKMDGIQIEVSLGLFIKERYHL